MTDLFHNYGFINKGIRSVTPREALELCEKGAILLDVREDYLNSFKMFKAKKVLYLPKSELAESYQRLSKYEYLICADSTGLHSKEAVIFLMEKGFDKVANLAGGLVEWERDNLPLETDITQRLTGSCACQLRPREARKKDTKV